MKHYSVRILCTVQDMTMLFTAKRQFAPALMVLATASSNLAACTASNTQISAEIANTESKAYFILL